MNMKLSLSVVFGGSILFFSQAQAHVSVISPPAMVKATSTVELGVGHGCEGKDVARVEVTIPPELTSIRPRDALLGRATFEKDDTGRITKIIWTKLPGTVLPADTHYYTVSFRAKMPNTPFKMVYLPTTQYCKAGNGEEIAVAWDQITTDHANHDTSNPAPAMLIFPVRYAGWNQFTTLEHLHDMSVFKDAEIVWKGSAAYSSNPVTTQMIQNDSSLTPLSEIHPGESFWVKF
ncbi:MAG TPA: DUF1775 domain-containing protein [Pseudomonadales bacterium]|nr:DUF1775 domain-containing protein [Pseudomonadales bacterium]